MTFFPPRTIVHPIDGASLMAGGLGHELMRAEAEILVLLSGLTAFSQTVTWLVVPRG